jgi:hypothetical protein
MGELDQALPRRRDAQSACAPLEQRDPEALFQAAQLVAHGGLAEVQSLGGAGGSARLRDRLNQPQISGFQAALIRRHEQM